ncbi:DUF1643 domain-containing protein [Amycolatopsis regifaucium]|uniref:DUF1643 domain-containing protein n=1 Tax=Amycolatopsis regifaucium TaxID=546365 RepID=A0A154MT76_9PSEU|nr:DUF1643 domain-containing protein [Amycolatopsis regifaucium]KZB87465.1 hypothetical protein AVL48_22780 [Amycolatopsis regifaucium]SFI06039.1 Protein of unknown function [Amycolatopsis regifaucium]
MPTASRRTLVAVLANPPLTDGKRTLRRVALAVELLGFDDVAVANLFSVPSHRTDAITELGAAEDGWLAARESLETCLGAGDGVLLAYGATSPSGEARVQFRQQVAWLQHRITAQDLPTWHVGDGPRHPSRWQRWTYRAHPDVPFAQALRDSLVPVQVDYVWPATRFERASRGDKTPLGRANSKAQRVEKIDVQAQAN